MEQVRVGVLGATGYSGAEAVRLLLGHPRAAVAAVTAEQHVGQRLNAVHPFLAEADWELEPADPQRLAGRVDVAIAALPEAASATLLPQLVEAGVRVIDVSAAFRIKDDARHRRWYGDDPAPVLRRAAVYGLTELHREEIRTAPLVANPGCYPTGALLALVPLLRAGLIDAPVIIDAKSGVTGARRKAAIEQLFAEVNESVRAYSIGAHRHGPEIDEDIERLTGRAVATLFSPHLVPMSRGILSTIYAAAAPGCSSARLDQALAAAYDHEPFVRLCPGRWPEVRETRGTNVCAIGWRLDESTGTVVLVTALDNLGKGAAGQAIQNMNVMFALAETDGLRLSPWGP